MHIHLVSNIQALIGSDKITTKIAKSTSNTKDCVWPYFQTQAAQAPIVRSYYFLNLYVNIQLVKRDIVNAIIYYYITTELHYAKRDSGLSAFGGAMLQKLNKI